MMLIGFFFFQAEDGIRDYKVTGVQTYALPISRRSARSGPRAGAEAGEGPGAGGGEMRRDHGLRLRPRPPRAAADRGGALPGRPGPAGLRRCAHRAVEVPGSDPGEAERGRAGAGGRPSHRRRPARAGRSRARAAEDAARTSAPGHARPQRHGAPPARDADGHGSGARLGGCRRRHRRRGHGHGSLHRGHRGGRRPDPGDAHRQRRWRPQGAEAGDGARLRRGDRGGAGAGGGGAAHAGGAAARSLAGAQVICTLAEAQAFREEARGRGIRVAVANGAFDLLHVGHLRYLQAAKEATGGGILIVGVNTDASVRGMKGPSRPIVPEQERAELVDALRCVDRVVLFAEPTAAGLLAALRPDLHVKGTDYTPESVPERELVASFGGRTLVAGDPKDHSTTDLIARLKTLP